MDTWAEWVQFIVSSIGQVASQQTWVNLGRRGGCGTEREPSAEQVLLLHCAGQSVHLEEKLGMLI